MLSAFCFSVRLFSISEVMSFSFFPHSVSISKYLSTPTSMNLEVRTHKYLKVVKKIIIKNCICGIRIGFFFSQECIFRKTKEEDVEEAAQF